MIVAHPNSLAEAIQYLSDHPQAKIVAGGTDLIPRLNQKLEEQTELCYVFGYPEMHGIRKTEDGGIFIGASELLANLNQHCAIADYTAIWQAASRVASPQIRNQGTIGGNILQENRCMFFNNHVPWSDVNHCLKWGGDRCYQARKSPDCLALFQSDVAPALIAYDAHCVISAPEGVRKTPVFDLYGRWGRNNKNLAHNEILVGIELPPLQANERSAYVRKALRGSFDFPLTGSAICLQIQDGIVTESRVIFGAAGTKPVPFKGVDAFLNGKSVDALPDIAKTLEKEVGKFFFPFQDTHVNGAARKKMGFEVFVKSVEACLEIR